MYFNITLNPDYLIYRKLFQVLEIIALFFILYFIYLSFSECYLIRSCLDLHYFLTH